MRLRPLVRAAFGAVVLTTAAVAAWIAWPLPPDLLDRRDVVSVRVLDRNGGLLREVPSREDGRSVPLPGGELPPLLRDAFVAAEDQRFWTHPGVDPLAVARAVVQNARAGRVVSGASTIPMQLARRLRPRPRHLGGKVAEALWALRLDLHLSKEALLVEYLDRVPLGRTLIGVEAASRAMFARPARALSPGQAALLAAMARSPARLDPWRRPDAARAAAGRVLDRMVHLGMISAEEAERARAAPLDLVALDRAFRAPHLTTAVLEGAHPEAVEIVTTVDAALQATAERIVREELDRLVDRGVTQAAALVVDVATGEILAWVGSAGLDRPDGWNDGTRARRQPGSALKPFAYGLALARGYTPASVLADTAVHLASPAGTWSPRNYDDREHGPVRLRVALGSSLNLPAVRLVHDLGPDRVLEVLRGAGFSLPEGPHHYGAGIVLGNGEVTLHELAAAYAGLARGGVWRPLRAVRAVRDARGTPLPEAPEAPLRRFLDEDVTELLIDLLADPSARVPAFGLDHALRLPFPVAAKTGTSHDHVDNWTIGFTRERVVAVWVGNMDGRPMRDVSGITGAGPIFRRLMLAAAEGVEAAPLVDRARFETAAVCPLTGAPAGPACPGVVHEVFLPGTVPQGTCPVHGVPHAHLASTWADNVVRGGSGARILHPVDGDAFVLDPGLPAEAQQIPVRVAPPADAEGLELRTGDGRVIPLSPPFRTRLPPERGTHELQLWRTGDRGPLATVRYTVR